MAEGDVMRRLQVAASQMGARLFRQQSGMGWVGKAERIDRPRAVHVDAGDVVIRNARPFHSGFDGWSDLGGFVPVVISPEMAGQTIAVYAQVEVKAGSRTTVQQSAWIAAVKLAGGRAGVARDEAELQAILQGVTLSA